MSAIGSYVRIKRSELPRLLDLARAIRSETSGRWLWKKTVSVGREEFDDACAAATLEERDFEYSGYVLGNYFTAQRVINGLENVPFDSPEGQVLARAYTAAFPLTKAVTFPPLPEQALREFCAAEYGEGDAAGMFEAISAAHRFYAEAIASLQADEAVIFIIS